MKKIINAVLVGTTAVALLSGCKLNTAGNNAAGGNAVTGSSAAADVTIETSHPAATTEKKTHAPAKPAFTVSQENAIRSAQSYLEMTGFSRAGLIQQLSSKAGEGFKRADAVFAVNHIKVNWNKQAVRAGKAYLEMSGFSRASLIQQLSSKAGDQFTRAQATYAANHLGF